MSDIVWAHGQIHSDRKSQQFCAEHLGFPNTGYAFHRHVWELIPKMRSTVLGWQLWLGLVGMASMQQQKKHPGKWFPRMMLYPKLSRVHNAGIRGGVTVSNAGKEDGSLSLSTWLISGVYELTILLAADIPVFPCSVFSCRVVCPNLQIACPYVLGIVAVQ